MSQEIIQVDAFTDRPFGGNPAAVCILDGPAPEDWMQNVATEMNLSETAFLYHEKDSYRLRWFTPAVEVELCGHATLASAHVLYEDGHLPVDRPARFNTKSGLLQATKAGDLIELDFPARPVTSCDAPEKLPEALRIQPSFVGTDGYAFLIEVDSERSVRGCQPDFNLLAGLSEGRAIVTSRSADAQFDFVSRFFAPGVGINEDPVTGAAHCALAPYWSQRLKKQAMVGYQASARGGVVHVRVEGDRVFLGGKAVTVMRGRLV